MRAVLQAASGLIYGVVSLLLVLGSVALALAQGGASGTTAPTFTPLPSSTSTPRPSSIPTQSTTAAAIIGVTPSASLASSSSPTWLPPTVGSLVVAATATRRSTCGAPYGWTQAYVVQPGDTLFRIATRYNVDVDDLQRANCRYSTLIYVGERLWVPYALPASTALTIIPTFPTPTEPATATDSPTPSDTPVTPAS